MFRIKVAASMFLVFAGVGAVVYVNVAEAVEADARTRVEQRLRIARRALTRIRQLNDYALLAKTEQVASWPQMAQILDKRPEAFADAEGTPPDADEFAYQVHRLMNAEVAVWRTRFEGLAAGKVPASAELGDYRIERPDLFKVVDARGIGVADAVDAAWFGADQKHGDLKKAFPALTQVIEQGDSVKDLLEFENALMTVAAVPVRSGDRILGAVVLGYRLTDAEAKRDQGLVDAEVAYFVGPRLNQSSSLATGAETELQKQVAAQKLYASPDDGKPHDITLNGYDYLAYTGRIPGYATASAVGFVTMGNLSAALAQAEAVLWVIPVAAVLGFLLSLGLVLVFYQRHLEPFEEIDQGVLEIINGSMDYWFEIKGKDLPGTMSQNLNIMVCQLSGRPLPEEDNATEGEHWAGDRMFVDEIDGSNFHAEQVDIARVAAGDHEGMPPAIVRLVNEDEATYQRRVFQEYTDGLRHNGQPIDGITFDKFAAQLVTSAEALKGKYKCGQVRFLVENQNGRVSLKPIPMN